MAALAVLSIVAFLGTGGPGTSVVPLLRVGQGVRASAMGEAYLGLADDASAVYWNPAGLARLEHAAIALSHHQWFAGITDELLHAGFPAGPGAVGLGLVFSREGGIERWHPDGEPGDTFSTSVGVGSLGYGFRLGPDYSVGIALKGLYEDLLLSSGYGAGLDAGFLARPAPYVSVAAGVRNLGFARGHDALDRQLPTEFGVGAALRLRRLAPGLPDLRATTDLLVRLGDRVSVRSGLEYVPAEPLALRLGYRTGPADLDALGLLGGLTAGLGVRVSWLEFGYCVAPYGKLGLTHRIGLEVGLPAGNPGQLRLRVVDAASLRPLPAAVQLSGVRSDGHRLGRSGEMRLVRLKPGTLVIHTSHPGYQPRADTMRIVGGEEQSATIVLERLAYAGITGTVYDAATRLPIAATIVYRGPVHGSLNAGPEQGTFSARSLPAGTYQLVVAGPSEDYYAQTCTLELAPGALVRRDFHLVRHRDPVVLEGINFETGKADILDRFLPVLARAAEILRAGPTFDIELSGHTDPREIRTAEFPSNWELSRARAEAVRRWLVEQGGIAPGRIEAHGYADTRPIAPNDTEEGMARNRRVEFRIIGE